MDGWVISLKVMNSAFVSKHIWNLVSGRSSIWAKWVRTCLVEDMNFWTIRPRDGCSWAWRKILDCRKQIRIYMTFEIGNGTKASTWHDRWHEMGPLDLYISKRDIISNGFRDDSTVAEIVDVNWWKWPLDWFGKYPVLNSIQCPEIRNGVMDKLWWISKDGDLVNFSTSGCYDDLLSHYPEVHWTASEWFAQRIPRHFFCLVDGCSV
ncbi:hypothetical protein SSX86_001769 [Deinandra increscens subsp. villosa]|uniref:Uncharacterized protein n=1 Tax=Deinandra increscens subsp. villosa TaxID=3103831 RepID=A0AAP0DZM7_9ASTR